MKRLLLSTALVAGIIACTGPLAAASAAPSGPPTSAAGSGTFRDNCTFDVDYVVTGKTKAIALPDGTVAVTAPGQTITLTANGNTASYVITGTLFVTAVGDTFEVTATGSNLLTRPNDLGIFLTQGNVNFAVTATDPPEEIRAFEGPGRVTDVCAALS